MRLWHISSRHDAENLLSPPPASYMFSLGRFPRLRLAHQCDITPGLHLLLLAFMVKCYQPAGTTRFVQITRLSCHGKMKTLPWIMYVSIHSHTGLNRNDPTLQRRRCSYVMANVNTLHNQLWAIFLFRDEDNIRTFSPYPDKLSVNNSRPTSSDIKIRRVKKTRLNAQLILNKFRQPVHVSGVSRSIIRRNNRIYRAVAT